MEPSDSVDGLGLTFADLNNANAAGIAQFRLTKRIEERLAAIQTNEVRDDKMAEFRAMVTESTRIAGLAQTEFEKIGR